MDRGGQHFSAAGQAVVMFTHQMSAVLMRPGCSVSHSAPFYWPGKAAQDGPRPGPLLSIWKTWNNFLALDLT